ncbi:hypothetical protein GCM10020370_04470 [Paenibacillus hodogayensis]
MLERALFSRTGTFRRDIRLERALTLGSAAEMGLFPSQRLSLMLERALFSRTGPFRRDIRLERALTRRTAAEMGRFPSQRGSVKKFV